MLTCLLRSALLARPCSTPLGLLTPLLCLLYSTHLFAHSFTHSWVPLISYCPLLRLPLRSSPHLPPCLLCMPLCSARPLIPLTLLAHFARSPRFHDRLLCSTCSLICSTALCSACFALIRLPRCLLRSLRSRESILEITMAPKNRTPTKRGIIRLRSHGSAKIVKILKLLQISHLLVPIWKL